MFFEGYRPQGKSEKYDREAFLERVRMELDRAGGASVIAAVRAVFQVLEEHVGTGEIGYVRGALPNDIRGLWDQSEG